MAPDLITRIVRQGLAIALLPSAVTGDSRGLSTIPVTHGPRRIEYLIWSEFNPTPATTAFLTALDESMKSLTSS